MTNKRLSGVIIDNIGECCLGEQRTRLRFDLRYETVDDFTARVRQWWYGTVDTLPDYPLDRLARALFSGEGLGEACIENSVTVEWDDDEAADY